LWLKTLYRKRAVTWPFIFYTIIWTLSMNLMLLIFIVLWLGYINHDFLISSFSSLGIFTFFYYQNIPMKYLLKRMFLIGTLPNGFLQFQYYFLL
ncbi:hypothetical protein, partial [Enterococcus faecium]|uniref:hypothetical protein n=1 Tax=Enterococcus faecium TaxID=1352 RepID=UPI003CC5C45A